MSQVFELALMAAAFVASAYATWWVTSGSVSRRWEWRLWGLASNRRETEERLRFVFDNSIDGIMTFLPDGTIVSCNPAAGQLFGRPPAQLIGQRLESPDIRAGMAMVIAALCAEGRSTIGNIRQIDRGYERIDERLRSIGASIERGEL